MSIRQLSLVCLLAQLVGCAGERQLRDELAALRLQLQSERERDASMRKQLVEVQRLLEEQRRRAAEQQQRLERMQRSLDAHDLALRKLEDRAGSSGEIGSGAGGAAPERPAPSFAGLVRRVGPNRYRLKRATLDTALGDVSALARGARLVPAVRDGQPMGFRVFAIRPGSFVQAIGLLNGDTVERVNSSPLTSPDSALEAYTKIRKAKQIVVEIFRRGQRHKLLYTVD